MTIVRLLTICRVCCVELTDLNYKGIMTQSCMSVVSSTEAYTELTDLNYKGIMTAFP